MCVCRNVVAVVHMRCVVVVCVGAGVDVYVCVRVCLFVVLWLCPCVPW